MCIWLSTCIHDKMYENVSMHFDSKNKIINTYDKHCDHNSEKWKCWNKRYILNKEELNFDYYIVIRTTIFLPIISTSTESRIHEIKYI
jgi:hypothetical protein